MIRAIVKQLPSEKQLDFSDFASQEDALSWFQPFIDKGVYGKKAYSQKNIITPAVLDEQGNEISPEVFEEIEIPAEFIIEFEQLPDLSIELEKQAKIKAGKDAREACQKVLDYVAGANLDRELTIEQITQIQQTFSQAESTLRAGRPTYAKYFISQIQADGVLVTQEIKDTCIELLAGY